MDQTTNNQLNTQEFKDVVQSYMSSGAKIKKIDLVCDLKRTADEMGFLGRLMTLTIMLGVVVGPLSFVWPEIGIVPLSVIMGLVVLVQLVLWKINCGWIDLLAKSSCKELISYYQENPFVPRIADLWKDYAPEEEKTGLYRRYINDATAGKTLSVPALIVITHSLRSWISQAERRKMIEEEKARIAQEFIEGQERLTIDGDGDNVI